MTEQDTHAEATPVEWSFLEAVEALRLKYPIEPQAFESDAPTVGPLIAGFREKWNSVAAKWYVLPIVKQINSFNGVLLDLLQVNFQALEGRLTAIDGRLAAIEGHLAVIKTELLEADERMIATDQDQTELGRTLAELHYQVVQMRRTLQPADEPGEGSESQ